jgi:ADP-heptose:LPS heptosyltransferase
MAKKKRLVKKVLVIRFSSIGDIVLSSPVVRALKQQAGLEVHYASKKAYAGLLSENPYIDKLHLLDDSLPDLIRQLKAEHFDHIVDLHHNLRTFFIKTALRRPCSAFKKLNREKFLLTAMKINRLPDVHIVDRYMQAAAVLGVKGDGQGLDYFLPEHLNTFPEAIPATHRSGYVVYSIGGMHATKRMPNEKITALCRLLKHPVILLGGPEDEANGTQVAHHSGSHVWNACGKMSLHESAFIIKMADLVISHDTGLMHIAAAFKKPLISVWGNTVPAFGMYPYMPGMTDRFRIVEVNGLPCRPCSKIGYQKCPKEHFDCMNRIDIDMLAAEADQMIERFKAAD